VRFVYRRAVEPELRSDRVVQDRVGDGAERIATAARSFAPVRTGRYRASITTRREGEQVNAIAAVPYGAFLEWGTVDTPTFAPLRRGLETVEGGVT
jgi:hypothetical protein